MRDERERERAQLVLKGDENLNKTCGESESFALSQNPISERNASYIGWENS